MVGGARCSRGLSAVHKEKMGSCAIGPTCHLRTQGADPTLNSWDMVAHACIAMYDVSIGVQIHAGTDTHICNVRNRCISHVRMP